MSATTTPLLTTKLHLPPARPAARLVPRPRLNARLDELPPLTLISAPPGFGKTTLVSEWLASTHHPAVWLSLDDDDNDPFRFFTYLVATLQTLKAEVGETSLALLRSPQPTALTAVLAALINDLAMFTTPFALVLDDYHVIAAHSIHEALTFLLDHLPPPMRVILIARADPPLPLARLRARDQLTELRADDLRFTPDEAAMFLHDVMHLNLTVADIAALEARTEGWVTGLQLAALSMRGRDDVVGFISAFSGSHRHILDYLAEEVLRRQPEDILLFLLQTSILDPLSGPLCDTVVGQVTGQAGSQAMLESLERANLFIIPLDEERRWYRYHHLFAEVLRHHLQQTHPERISELHHRASVWYEAGGFVAEAVDHALAAHEAGRAAQLIEQAAQEFLGRGEVTTLQQWLQSLPEDAVRARPRLSVTYAWVMALQGQAQPLENWLEAAEQGLTDEASTQSEGLRGEVTALRALVALNQQDLPRVITLCEQALQRLPAESAWSRGFIAFNLANAYKLSGNLTEAMRTFAEAIALGQAANNRLLTFFSLTSLADLQETRGQLHNAAATLRQAQQLTTDRAGRATPLASFALFGLSKLSREWNDLETADHYLQQAMELGHQVGFGLEGLLIDCLITLTLVRRGQGDVSGAQAAIQEAAQRAQAWNRPEVIVRVGAFEARLWLAQGQVEPALRWAQAAGLRVDGELTDWLEIEYATLARVLAAQGKPGEALHVLERVRQQAEAAGHIGRTIEALALEALTYQALNDMAAMTTLERALSLAEPEGYTRIFLDEGGPMRRLISDLRLKIGNLQWRAYADKLLVAFGPSVTLPTPTGHPQFRIQNLVEPLSDRELEVLRLVAAGYSNPEIAEKLIVSTGTIKTHVNNIYRKLEVKNRTQAAARARELGLLAD